MKNVAYLLRAALALAFLIGMHPNVVAAADLVIPVVTSLTGPFAFVGKQEADALALLEKSTNAGGGYKGQRIHFDVQDDASNPQVDVQLVNAIVAKGAPIILGPTSVGGCLAIAPLTRNGPVVYCMSPGVRPEQGSMMFSAGVSSDDIVLAFIRYFRDAGLRRVAALWTTDASGQDAERAFTAALALRENASMQLTSSDHFNPADLSVTAQMSKIASSNAQWCICFATGSPYGTILRAYGTAGMKMPLASSTGNMIYSQMLQFQSLGLDQLYFVGAPFNARASLPPGPVRDQVEAFYNAIKGTATKPDAGAGPAWDSARIIVAALHDLGPGATAAQVRDYIERLRAFPGINGMFDFVASPHRGLNASNAVVVRWDPAKQDWVPVPRKP